MRKKDKMYILMVINGNNVVWEMMDYYVLVIDVIRYIQNKYNKPVKNIECDENQIYNRYTYLKDWALFDGYCSLHVCL